MGGHAFASGPKPLNTPRMPSEVYEIVKDFAQKKLRELFLATAAPLDGPAKSDFGDVDILVALEKRLICSSGSSPRKIDDAENSIWVEIQRFLGAEQLIKDKGQPSAHYAVPWPTHLLPAGSSESQALYVQVDVTICPSLDFLSWRLFKHGHGDFWNILGSALRPLGLTIDDGAIWLRHPGIEKHHKKRAKIHLSSDPAEILTFLGLAHGGTEWEQPFASVDELFEYITSCKYFFTWASRDNDESHGAETVLAKTAARPTEATTAAEAINSASDRRKAKERPVVARYFNEFLPRVRSADLFPPPADCPTPYELRSVVRQDAFAFFPGTEAVYDRIFTDWDTEQSSVRAWTDGIKAVVPPAVAAGVKLQPGQVKVVDENGTVVALAINFRGVVCSALKKIIVGTEGAYERYGVAKEDLGRLRDERGVLLLEEVKDFVVRNWESVGVIAWPENQKRSAEHLKKKIAKDETQARNALREDGQDK